MIALTRRRRSPADDSPPTFGDPGVEARFRRLGFVVTRFADPDLLAALRSVADQLGPAPGDPQEGFFPAINSTSLAWKRELDERMRPLVEPRLADWLADHHLYSVSILAKWPDTAWFPAHQDPTMVDLAAGRPAVTFWIPLTTLSDEGGRDRGTLRVVPGTHRLVTGPSADHPFNPQDFEHLAQPIQADLSHAVPLAPGEGIAFDHRLVHLSGPNRTTAPRFALALACRPRDVPNVHVEQRDDHVEVFRVDDDFYFGDRTIPTAAGAGADTMLRRVPLRPRPPLSVRELRRAARHAALQAEDLSPIDAAPGAGSDVGPTTRRPRPAPRSIEDGPAFGDLALDAQLEELGYVVVPFLPSETAAELARRYAELHPSTGAGFEPDLCNPDADYRRAVEAAAAPLVGDAAARLLPGHEPFLWSYLCKWPGEAEDLYLHRDWTFVDERRRRRSLLVWIALDDVDEDNGALLVLPRSHRLPGDVTGTHVGEPFLAHRPALAAMTTRVTVPAGAAVVFDHALVHGSLRNRTDRPRLALGCAVRRHGEQLHHFRRRDDRWVERFDVDPEFFVTHTPERLMAAPPQLPVAETIELVEGPAPRIEELLAELADLERSARPAC